MRFEGLSERQGSKGKGGEIPWSGNGIKSLPGTGELIGAGFMDSREEALYRLRLVEGYLREAEEFYGLSRWRASVSSSQLTVENAAKAFLSLIGPVPKSHDLSGLLLDAIEGLSLDKKAIRKIERLSECTRIMGLKEHILIDYGDELAFKTPWEIYDEARAKRALELAREAYGIARELVG